jgi:hypothetical protein
MKFNWIVSAFMVIFLAGCNSHMVYVHETTVGINVAPVNPGSGTAKISIGYERDTYAMVPQKKDNEEAMSLTAVSRVRANGLNKIQFGHVVATGKAGEIIAKDPEAIRTAKQNLSETQEKLVKPKETKGEKQ